MTRLEQLVKDLALLAQAVAVVHDSLTERAQTQPEIAERLAPIREGAAQVYTDASALHAEIAERSSGSSRRAASRSTDAKKPSRKRR